MKSYAVHEVNVWYAAALAVPIHMQQACSKALKPPLCAHPSDICCYTHTYTKCLCPGAGSGTSHCSKDAGHHQPGLLSTGRPPVLKPWMQLACCSRSRAARRGSCIMASTVVAHAKQCCWIWQLELTQFSTARCGQHPAASSTCALAPCRSLLRCCLLSALLCIWLPMIHILLPIRSSASYEW